MEVLAYSKMKWFPKGSSYIENIYKNGFMMQKEENVHCTKTTILALSFLFENVTLIVYKSSLKKTPKNKKPTTHTQNTLIFWLNISFCCPGPKAQPAFKEPKEPRDYMTLAPRMTSCT